MDGTDYTQSLALLRYAGKIGGLYPEDPLEALKVSRRFDGGRLPGRCSSVAMLTKIPTAVKRIEVTSSYCRSWVATRNQIN